jgi:hypothetical protein
MYVFPNSNIAGDNHPIQLTREPPHPV